MLCPRCKGNRRIRSQPEIHRFGVGYDMEICPYCIGFGTTYCCDGEIENDGKSDRAEELPSY